MPPSPIAACKKKKSKKTAAKNNRECFYSEDSNEQVKTMTFYNIVDGVGKLTLHQINQF